MMMNQSTLLALVLVVLACNIESSYSHRYGGQQDYDYYWQQPDGPTSVIDNRSQSSLRRHILRLFERGSSKQEDEGRAAGLAILLSTAGVSN